MYDLQKRFCKDLKLPIKIFYDEIFINRLKLFGAYDEYVDYMLLVSKKFGGYSDKYLEYYNNVKDEAINFLKNSEAYQKLNTWNMDEFPLMFKNYPKCDVYKQSCIGKSFISIDMCKANFTALVHFGLTYKLDFFRTYNYNGFISQFTDIEHIKKSKYIRQVIFGNCNPKRQIHYETYLMNQLLARLLDLKLIKQEYIYALLSDEILLDANKMSEFEINSLKYFIDNFKLENFPVSYEYFKVEHIKNSDVYVKRFKDNSYELKCVNPDEAPFIYRFMNNEEYNENDFYFEYNNKLAKFMVIPQYELEVGQNV